MAAGAAAAGAAGAAGAGRAGLAATLEMSSAGSAITAIRSPTGTWPPSAITILRSTPLPNASTSTLALSVSTSARMSPPLTASPSFLSHLMTLPVSMVSDSLGMITLVIIALHTRRMAAAILALDGVFSSSRFLAYGIGTFSPVTRSTGASRSSKALLGDLRPRSPSPSPAKPAPASSTTARCVFRTEPMMVLGVERPEGARVDDLDRDALLGELLGDLERPVEHAHVGDDRDVGALATDHRLAERDQEVRIVRHLALHGVERLALDEDDRIVVADGGLEQALGVGRRRRPHHLEPGHVRRSTSPSTASAARRAARAGPPGPRNTIGTLNWPPDIWRILAAVLTIWSRARIEKLNVIISTIGRSPTIAAPIPTPVKPDLGDGRVDDALLAELLEQPLGHLVGAVVVTDLLAHDEDARVAVHLLAQGDVERLAIGHHRHGVSPCTRR